MNLAGWGMAATDLAALLPALAVTLPAGSSIQGGTLNVKLSSEGLADKLVTTGNLVFTNVRLAGFDFGKKMAAVGQMAGIQKSTQKDHQNASTEVRAAAERKTAQDNQDV